MNGLFYFDGLGHQELENIAHDRRGGFIEFVSSDLRFVATAADDGRVKFLSAV